MSALRSTAGSVRRPEYTGENRCWPCTTVNVVLAGAAAAAIAVVAVEVALVAFGGALAAIWLRGYLVPGTPELTRRYLPERVLALFGKRPQDSPSAGIDPETYLLDAGALVEVPGGEYAFSPAFEEAWWERLAAMDEEPDAAAITDLTALDDATSLATEWRGDAFVALADGERIGDRESRAAFRADVASERVLADSRADWRTMPLAHRSDVLGALRLFVESCPSCEGVVTVEEDVVESCCTRYAVVAGTCSACHARLFELDLPPDLSDGGPAAEPGRRRSRHPDRVGDADEPADDQAALERERAPLADAQVRERVAGPRERRIQAGREQDTAERDERRDRAGDASGAGITDVERGSGNHGYDERGAEAT